MFCVECGAEGPTYQGLCARDFLKKHPVVAPPDVLDLDRCTSCGSFRLASGWSQIDRDLTPQEIRGVRTFVLARVDRSGDAGAFISRIEDVHGGLDFYLSTNALGKTLAREVSESFGGSVSSSPKLFGQKEGREVYRVTSLVRLSAFHVGDVVRHKGVLAEVTSVRPFVVLRDLTTGEARRFKPKDVRTARRVDAERFEAKIERLESGQVVAIHPESEEARPVRPRPEDRTARAVVVWTPDGAYLSKVPPGPSKA